MLDPSHHKETKDTGKKLRDEQGRTLPDGSSRQLRLTSSTDMPGPAALCAIEKTPKSLRSLNSDSDFASTNSSLAWP